MLKKISTSLMLIMIALNLNAQLKEGVITYNISYESDNPQIAQMASQMGASMKLYSKGKKTRIEMSGMMVGTNIVIGDYNSKEAFVLVDHPMVGKKYKKIASDKFDKVVNPTNIKDVQTLKKTDEHQDILGYDCVKYEISSADGKYELWIADEIKSLVPMFNGKITGVALLTKMDGFVQGMQIKSEIKATAIDKVSVDDSKFDMTIPEGYSELEQEL